MRIGMVSTRFAGTDGVSLETAKVAEVLGRSGHDVAWFAGELGDEFAPGLLHAAAHFTDPAELTRQTEYFGNTVRRPDLIDEVQTAADDIKGALRRFSEDFGVDVLMPQNALAIPMQIPLAVAIGELATEGMPVLAHHHDLAWERERFSETSIPDLLDAYFPPRGPSIHHLVINSLAQEQLARRRGLVSAVLPNVMDFARDDPEPRDGERFRAAAGLSKVRVVLLQPTRVIPRKSIETSIEFAQHIEDAVIVITHEEGDEGDRYGQALRTLAEQADVDLRFVPVGTDPAAGPTLADAYDSAALVLYPSRIEGFGNALLEAFFYRRPVLIRRYPVYVADIAPTGVQCLEFGDYLTGDVINQARGWIDDPDSWKNAVEQNYEVGRRSFSLEVAQAVVDRALTAFD
jgi:glycosyltransferase involved in cell wall biosynthesis